MSVRDPVREPPNWRRAPIPDRFGPIVTGYEVEQAIAHAVETYMPDYLTGMERQRQLSAGSLPNFRALIATSFDADRFSEDQLPSLSIVSREIAEVPNVRGDGVYLAKWRVDCTAVCSARGNREARRLAQLYAGAVRALLIQRLVESEELDVLGVDWRGERYTVRAPTDERTLGEALAQLHVHVADVTNRYGGPLGPIRSTDVYVTKQEEP